jgi:hypothetical protein
MNGSDTSKQRSETITESDRQTSLKEIGNFTASAGAAPAEESRQGQNTAANKPKPIITGNSQAEGIANFAHRATYEDLTPERRERLKVSVLDSFACAIGLPPILACLEQAKQFGGSDARCTLIGGGKANVVYAAQTTQRSSDTSTSWTVFSAGRNSVTHRTTLDQSWPHASTRDDQAKNF